MKYDIYVLHDEARTQNKSYNSEKYVTFLGFECDICIVLCSPYYNLDKIKLANDTKD